MILLLNQSNTCDRCGHSHPDLAQFARAYRAMELKHGRGNPGNLCGKCAGDETAARIIAEGGNDEAIGKSLKALVRQSH